MTSEQARRAIDAAWRIESPKLVATLARMLRDVGMAEEFAQDALVAALETWTHSGVPDNPGAWLMATAKHRAIDFLRRKQMLDRKHEQLGWSQQGAQDDEAARIEAQLDDDIGDDLLRLIFVACHPVLPTEARVALTLRLIGGLTTTEIARAYLAPEATIAQRIVRAKRTLAEKDILFEVPGADERIARLQSVLEVIYLIFNEGYAATSGDDWMRPGLCEDAIRVGRVLAGLVPDDAETHGLVALMELQASRARARLDASGEPILLREQNRSRWDQLLIRRGLAALDLAERLDHGRGAYTLQAAIAACHARANDVESTDWKQIAALYAELAAISPSPVIELNRAVAVSMAEGPQLALDLVDTLRDLPALAHYHLLPVVRGDLLAQLGRAAEARAEFERAATMTRNERERALLLERARSA
ncbi:MAG TPA: RNA polymerase sigma factor [Dokdonella sp.]|uniref:RNA polymerase sigma factor n=1 Tax=Dokdonella sp. TaxID=2291710 RepID=UPI002C83AA74|nr:RNA polymerase sigma factor [Dokdonella sp.]HOX71198.1 RNA polymerase sigma factor [Dokdonella sp.]HPG92973.1 RNA polymerase sigma factor [Dokdonella sp.]HPN78809.1 RNA polymerase sigma factor [Dokdonella sp.]